MSRDTNIEWCDSSVNPVMGCGGCELWSKKGGGTCYAALLTQRYAGKKGFPREFTTPELFPGRMEQAAEWSDLTGVDRDKKPWLNKRPRHIFVADMGDLFSETIPFQWIYDNVFKVMLSEVGNRHIYIVLTKRAKRLVEFERFMRETKREPWPLNCIAMTSITSQKTIARLDTLLQMPERVKLGLSVEPLLDEVNLVPSFIEAGRGVDWCITGAESGEYHRPMNLDHVRLLRDQCAEWEIPFFYKQNATATGEKIQVPELDGVQWTEMVNYLPVNNILTFTGNTA